MRRLLSVLIPPLFASISSSGSAERLGYPASEFIARRHALAHSLGSGLGDSAAAGTIPPAGVRFRQDNDFYYFTGSEDVNAVLVMDAATATRGCSSPSRAPGRRSDPTARTGSRKATRPRRADGHGDSAARPS